MDWMTRSTKMLLTLQGFLVVSCVYRAFERHDAEWGAIAAFICYSMYLNTRSDYRQYKVAFDVLLKKVARVPPKNPPPTWRFGVGPICSKCGKPDVPRSINPNSCECPDGF